MIIFSQYAVRGIYKWNILPDAHTGEVTPVPIPNTDVKLSRADGTAFARVWESRLVSGFFLLDADSRRERRRK